jgi:DNA mismatch repair protein MutS2
LERRAVLNVRDAAMTVTKLHEKALHDLEWRALTEHLAGRCLGPEASRRLRELEPDASFDEASQRARLVAEALAAAADDAAVPARALPSLGEPLARVVKGGTASGEQLRDVTLLLDATAELRGYAERQRAARPRLAAALASDATLEQLRELLSRSIERDGSVSDHASTALREARRRVGDVRRELGVRLNQLMKRFSEVLRGEFWTERDGRFVLPVRSDAHVRVSGIVLASSASGSTLYVEPEEVTNLGNRLKVAEAEVEREEARVLAELSARVAERGPALERALGSAVEADVLQALCRFSRDASAHCLVPDREAGADLIGMRHPLLVIQGGDVVANDIVLAPGKALVISGPNAGGKTVALKCLGLAAWMARAGVPVPCDERSKLGWFDSVLTDVGDDQSLMRSLSTFSAHVQNLGAILDAADRHALVLLDEVAAGTDPEEGAALASAVLEALVERGAAVAVTTHYERLKELAATDARFANASVGFEIETMSPTFRLTLGVPGASSALAVAARFGVPAEVVRRAAELLPERALSREELVKKLERERSELEALRRAAEGELRKQNALTAELAEERQRAREQERARLMDEARTLTADVRTARAQLREAKKRLGRDDASREELRAVERHVNDAAKQIAIGSALESATRPATASTTGRQPKNEAELVPGARVYLEKLARFAEVTEAPHKGQVKVLAGALKLSVPVSEIRIAKQKAGDKPAPKKQKTEAPRLAMRDGFVPVRTQSNTLDVRGHRVEEAVEAVDAFVDRMLKTGEAAAFVLHGHGTGALKLAIRAHLSAARLVKKAAPAEPDDGGDAFTLFWLE